MTEYMLRHVYADDTVEIDGPIESIEAARAEAEAYQVRYARSVGQADAVARYYLDAPFQFPPLVRTEIQRAELTTVEVAWA